MSTNKIGDIDFGQCFQAFLRENKLTQTRAAELLGWSQNTVGYYCRLKKLPRAHVLAHMAATFRVPADRLLGKTKSTTVLRETAPEYGGVPQQHPAVIWLTRLHNDWHRQPKSRARIELAVRTAWGDNAAEILKWLEGK